MQSICLQSLSKYSVIKKLSATRHVIDIARTTEYTTRIIKDVWGCWVRTVTRS